MKKVFAGAGALLGIVAALLGLAARFLPVSSSSQLAFLTGLSSLIPYWLILTVGGGVLAAALLIWLAHMNRKTPRERPAEPAPIPIDQIYRADNLDIRSRVRDLLHRAWGGPLLALLLGALPLAAAHAITHIFLQPFQKLFTAVWTPFQQFFTDMGDIRVALALIASGTPPDFSGTLAALMACIPGLLVFTVVCLLALEPMRVSRADYFTKLLYGRKPSPLTVYGCFGKPYIRAFGGMAYSALWLTIWAVLAVAGPPAFYIGGITLFNGRPEIFTTHLLILWPLLIALTVILFVIFAVALINRWLAYSFVPCVLATQKNLPARRAMRASRYLARKRKTRILGMWLSFLYYFLPAVCALVLLPMVTPLGNIFGFTEYLSQSLRRFFIAVILLNQLLLAYVAPVAYASFYALYLEAKREFRENHPMLQYILGSAKKKRKGRRSGDPHEKPIEPPKVIHEPVELGSAEGEGSKAEDEKETN